MKIALLTPPWNYSTLKGRKHKSLWEYVKLSSDITSLGVIPPAGILYIASALKSQGHAVWVIDGYYNSRKDMLKKIGRINPDVTGISTVSCLWKETCELSKEIIKNFPGTKIILGGEHVNYAKEKCLLDIPEAASIIIGAGEQPMVDILKKIENREKIEKICCRNLEQPQKYFEPDFDLLDGPVKRYIPNVGFYNQLPFVPIFTSKGCNRSCAFCNNGKQTTKLFVRNAVDIIDQVKRYKNKYNIRTVNFYDDCGIFENNREESMILCRELIKQKFSVKWSMYLTGFRLDKELLKLMKGSGCFRIHCAVESGVQKNRDYVRCSSIPLPVIEEQISQIKEAGIETYGRFMFGIFGESYEEGLETIKYARRLKLDYASFIKCILAPGTKMFEDLLKIGKINNDMSSWNYYGNFYSPYPMNNHQQSKLIKLGYLNFYLHPSALYNNLFNKNFSFQELKTKIFIIKRLVSDMLN